MDAESECVLPPILHAASHHYLTLLLNGKLFLAPIKDNVQVRTSLPWTLNGPSPLTCHRKLLI